MPSIDDLLGLPLSIFRNNAGLGQFHFGQIRVDGTKSWGQYALHVSCQWSIEYRNEVLVADSDQYIDNQGNPMPKGNPFANKAITLMSQFIDTHKPITQRYTEKNFLMIGFSGTKKSALIVWPDFAGDENYRLFRPGIPESDHYIR